jgi:hypothetical protein
MGKIDLEKKKTPTLPPILKINKKPPTIHVEPSYCLHELFYF